MKKVLVFFIFLVAAGGCASEQKGFPPLPHAVPVDPPKGSLMLTANTYAGDAISAELLQRIGSGSGILAATMADMENLDDSAPFGRTSMQQIGSRVVQHGFKVLDVRLTDSMRMDLKQGEFMLSHDTTRIMAKEYDAHAVLVGLFSRSADRVFVSVRAIRLDDAAVIAAYEYFLPRVGDVQTLLSESRNGGGGQSLDRWTRRSRVTSKEPALGVGYAGGAGTPATRSSVERAPASGPSMAAQPSAVKTAPCPPVRTQVSQPVMEKDAPAPDLNYLPESYTAPGSGGVGIDPAARPLPMGRTAP